MVDLAKRVGFIEQDAAPIDSQIKPPSHYLKKNVSKTTKAKASYKVKSNAEFSRVLKAGFLHKAPTELNLEQPGGYHFQPLLTDRVIPSSSNPDLKRPMGLPNPKHTIRSFFDYQELPSKKRR